MISNPFGRRARRAAEEQEERLFRLNLRLDALESVPAPKEMPYELSGELVGRLMRIEAQLEQLIAEDESLGRGVEAAHQKVKELVFAVDEGIERTTRAESRIRGAVARAKKELAKLGYEDPGLEAESEQLRLLDGDGGAPVGMPAVPSAVEEPGSAPSSIKGVSAAALQRVRGF